MDSVRAARFDKLLADGHMFLGRGQIASARKRFREAARLEPGDPRGFFYLGATLLTEGNAAEALSALRSADRLAPNNADVATNLGLALAGSGDTSGARAALERARALRPDDDRIAVNLANVLMDLGAAAQALDLLAKAGQSGEILLARAHALLALRRPDDALAMSRAARARLPDSIEASNIERIALQSLGRFADALSLAQRQVSQGDPAGAAGAAISEIRTALGDIEGGVAAVEAATKAFDGLDNAPLELLRLRAMRRLNADGGAGAATQEAHLALGRRYEAVSKPQKRRTAADPERRLKIGFVSPDLRAHSVMNFLLGPLAAFDPGKLAIHLYSNAPEPDRVTERAQALAHAYLDIRAMDAETAAQHIREDGIDILIDLAGHSVGSRLDVFARQPVPVQMTWLGYPFSTGMKRVQYRLSDPVADPPDLARPGYTERFLHLNHFLCYAPLDAQEPPKPRSGDAPLVFGALNNLDKYDTGTLRLWARTMARSPDSRLIVRQRHLRHAEARDAWRDRLVEHGFDPQRIDLGPFDDSRPNAQFAIHDEIDICLDPLIYDGTTTTCNALWMGVPVIVTPGRAHAARVGASIMAAAGLPEFVACDEADAAEKIVALAQDRARLAEYRRTLRSRLQASPLCDAAGFARDFEDKLRFAWREYCAKA